MAHPFASQSASSVSRRLKAVGGKGASAGKAWGSTAMASKTGHSYPGKHAGSQVPYFAEGGSVGSRPDRAHGKKGGKKKGHTTNVIVSIPPSSGPPVGAAPGQPPAPPAPPIPIQIPRAAPPVAAGPPALPPGPMAMPPRPPMAGPPGLPPGARPPGMKAGGSVKRAAGGALPAQASPNAVAALGARPALPTQARGARPFKDGGGIKQGGGGTKQFGEGSNYPVMKNGNSGLGRLEKIKKAPV